jgi:hypothetical protein
MNRPHWKPKRTEEEKAQHRRAKAERRFPREAQRMTGLYAWITERAARTGG